jgi:hypothetical protein
MKSGEVKHKPTTSVWIIIFFDEAFQYGDRAKF